MSLLQLVSCQVQQGLSVGCKRRVMRTGFVYALNCSSSSEVRQAMWCFDLEATDYVYSVCECMYTLAICAVHPGNWVFRQGRICLCFDALLGLCSCNVLPWLLHFWHCVWLFLYRILDTRSQHCTCWSWTQTDKSSVSAADLLSVCEPAQTHCCTSQNSTSFVVLVHQQQVTSAMHVHMIVSVCLWHHTRWSNGLHGMVNSPWFALSCSGQIQLRHYRVTPLSCQCQKSSSIQGASRALHCPAQTKTPSWGKSLT